MLLYSSPKYKSSSMYEITKIEANSVNKREISILHLLALLQFQSDSADRWTHQTDQVLTTQTDGTWEAMWHCDIYLVWRDQLERLSCSHWGWHWRCDGVSRPTIVTPANYDQSKYATRIIRKLRGITSHRPRIGADIFTSYEGTIFYIQFLFLLKNPIISSSYKKNRILISEIAVASLSPFLMFVFSNLMENVRVKYLII